MSDWRPMLLALRLPLALLMFTLLAGGLILHVSGDSLESAEGENRELKSSFASVLAHTEFTRKQAQLLESYRETYAHYESEGLIGPPHRERWLDTLDSLRHTQDITSLDYSLAPAMDSTSEGKSLQVSNMTLRFNVTHEVHLLSFLKSLYDTDSGLVAIRYCTLMQGTDAKLVAECGLEWYSLPDGKEPT
jgi:hypothetical protein